MCQKTALSLIAMAVTLCSLASRAESANWQTDLEQARTMASQQNKLLLIHFWTPDCAPCKVIEKTVFPTSEVEQAIQQNYIPLKVNALQDATLRDFFKVRRWPTDVIATTDGQAIHQMATPQDARQYATVLTSVANSHRGNFPSATSNEPFSAVSANATTSQPQWSHGIAAPDLPESTARAVRPGVDIQAAGGFESPLGGPMMPEPGSQNRFETPGPEPSRAGTSPNQFAMGQRSMPAAPTQAAQAEIRNPYANSQDTGPQSPTTPSYGSIATAPQQPTIAPQVPNVPQPTAGYQSPHGVVQNNHVRSADPPTSTEQPIGLDGRCPVTLVAKRKWIKGSERWGAVHRGKTYLFAGFEEQQIFLADPDQFSPVLAGMDVVALAAEGQIVQGQRRFGVLYDDDGNGPRPNRIYLFDSAATRDRFEATPESYVQPVMQALRQNQLQTLVR